MNNQLTYENNSRVLSERDTDLVLSLLNNPPEPNNRLKNLLLNAAARWKEEEKDF